MTTYGILIFDGAEELDFTGPWEVFTASSMLREHADTAVLIAEHPGAVRCNKGMQVLPDHTLDDHPPLDVLLAPGGNGTRREVSNPVLIDWIRKTAADVTWTTSVCTGPCCCTRQDRPAAEGSQPTACSRTLCRPGATSAWSATPAMSSTGTWSPVRRLGWNRHGPVARRPPPRPRPRSRRAPVHPVRTCPALPR